MWVPAVDGSRAGTLATRSSPAAMGPSIQTPVEVDEQRGENEQDAQDMEAGHIGSLNRNLTTS